MNKTEQATIRNIVARLKKPNCGCANSIGTEQIVAAANEKGIEAVSRLYLDTWVIPALELLLSGERHNVELARDLSAA